MVYRILTNLGKGWESLQSTQDTANRLHRCSPLRVSENATLIAFENQPDSVLAGKDARAYGKILWCVTEDILHPDDLPAAKVFSSGREFDPLVV